MITDLQQTLLQELRQPNIEKSVQLLYEYYFDGIVAQIVANGGNQEDGADIFQEAVLVLIEKIKTGQFRNDSSIKTFLSGIARNLWLFELRTRDRRKKREQLYMTDEEKEVILDTNFFNTQTNTDLQTVLIEIGDPCKQLLTGYYYHNKSMKELLALFNYENEQVLRNKKSKCMKKLKELLQKNTSLLQNLKNLLIYEQ